MKLIDRHDTRARHPRPGRRHAILFTLAVVVVALAWLSLNALIRLITLD